MLIKLLHQILAIYYWAVPVSLLVIGSAVFMDGNFAQTFSIGEYIGLTLLAVVGSVPAILLGIGIWKQKKWGYIGGLIVNLLSAAGLLRQFGWVNLLVLTISTALLLFFLVRKRKALV